MCGLLHAALPVWPEYHAYQQERVLVLEAMGNNRCSLHSAALAGADDVHSQGWEGQR